VEADSARIIWTAKILPLLLELYIGQCVHMGVDYKGTLFQSKKRKARSKYQNTAFMFWKWCHHDALALLKSNQELGGIYTFLSFFLHSLTFLVNHCRTIGKASNQNVIK